MADPTQTKPTQATRIDGSIDRAAAADLERRLQQIETMRLDVADAEGAVAQRARADGKEAARQGPLLPPEQPRDRLEDWRGYSRMHGYDKGPYNDVPWNTSEARYIVPDWWPDEYKKTYYQRLAELHKNRTQRDDKGTPTMD